MIKKKILFTLCSLVLVFTILGFQAATVAHASNDKNTLKNAVQYFLNKKQDLNIQKLFNPLLSTKVKKGELELTIGLVNTSSRYQTVSVSQRPYTVSIKNSKGETVKKIDLDNSMLKDVSIKQIKQGRSKALQYVEKWDLRDSKGNAVQPGKYKAVVEWTIKVNSKSYSFSISKNFTVDKKDVRDVKPVPTPEVKRDVLVEIDLIKKDGKLNIDFALVNKTEEDLELSFGSGQKYDIFITDVNNKEVYRWSKGRFFTMALEYKTLKRGERMSFSEVWDYTDNDGKKVSAGKYKVKVVLLPLEYPELSNVNYKFAAEKEVSLVDADIKYDIDVVLDVKKENRQLKISFIIKNRSALDYTLKYWNGQLFDVIITGLDGKELYRWSDDMMFTQALRDWELKAGQSQDFLITWDLTDKDDKLVPPGEYKVKVEFVPYLVTNATGDVANGRTKLTAEKSVELVSADINKYAALTIEPKIVDNRLQIPYSLKNIYDYDLNLEFTSGQRHEIIITDKDGKEVHRWSDGRYFIQWISSATIEKGKSWDDSDSWDMKDKNGKPVPKGIYNITVLINGTLSGPYVTSVSEWELKTVKKFEIK